MTFGCAASAGVQATDFRGFRDSVLWVAGIGETEVGLLGFGGRMQTRLDGGGIGEGGRVFTKDDSLHVEGADAVTILISCATDYVRKAPTFRGNPHEEVSAKQLEAASKKTYAHLRADHIDAYQRLFRWMTIELGKSAETIASRPTDGVRAGGS